MAAGNPSGHNPLWDSNERTSRGFRPPEIRPNSCLWPPRAGAALYENALIGTDQRLPRHKAQGAARLMPRKARVSEKPARPSRATVIGSDHRDMALWLGSHRTWERPARHNPAIANHSKSRHEATPTRQSAEKIYLIESPTIMNPVKNLSLHCHATFLVLLPSTAIHPRSFRQVATQTYLSIFKRYERKQPI